MRLLTLIRHAKSSWDYPELGDFERPLNARGRRDAPEMARRLVTELESPLTLVTSPALRAITTAHAFADALGQRHETLRIEPRIYEASLGTLLDIVNRLDDGIVHAVLFGHNPGFSELAHLFADPPFGEMPTCGALTLRFEVERWREAAPRSAQMLRYRCPKNGDG